MRIPFKKTKGVTTYKPPVLGEVPKGIIDVSKILVSEKEKESINDKLKKLLNYFEPTSNGLVVKGTMKSSNFVRNLKGWGISVNKEGDAYFKTVTAGSYVQVFVQASVPTSIHINDIWYDSDDDYKQYYAVIAGATTIAAEQWVAANFPTEWADVGDGVTTKPDNNATLGATFGTDIAGGGALNTQVTNAGYATLFRQDKFGDGNDGDATISSNTSLTTDVFYNNLTVNSGVTLDTNGYRIFVKGILTLTGTGKVARNGNAGGNGTDATGNGSDNGSIGVGGVAGAALANGSIMGALAGVAGKDGVLGKTTLGVNERSNGNAGGAGGSGTNVTKSIGTTAVDGKAAGTGGNGVSSGTATGGAGGALGTGGTKAGTVYNQVRSIMAAYLLYDIIDGDNLRSSPSSGGAASGGSGGAATYGYGAGARSGISGGSGGGGSTGGIVCVFTKTLAGSGTIEALGGDAGDAGVSTAGHAFGPSSYESAAGGAGGSSGGAGGTGGVVIVAYETNSGTVTFLATGGTGGTKASGGAGAAVDYGGGSYATNGADGNDGNAGAQGVVIELTT